jgi:hypothetical protein
LHLMKTFPLDTFRSSTPGLPRDFARTGFSRATCVFRQPAKFAPDPSRVRVLESRREPSLRWICRS